MSLYVRLLAAFVSMALLSTTTLGLLVRVEWRHIENDRFESQVRGVSRGITLEIRAEQDAVHDMLRPLCQHDAFVDSVLVALEANELDGGRRLAIAQLVPEEMKALRLDELVLITNTGEVLGAGNDRSVIGTIRKDIARALDAGQGSGQVRVPTINDGILVPAALTGSCIAYSENPRNKPQSSVGLLGARHLNPILERLSNAYGVRLAILGPEEESIGQDETTQINVIDESTGLRLLIAKPRRELDQSLSRLDQWMLITALITLVLAVALSVVVARSLAKPLSALSHEVGEVVKGEPREIVPHGSKEMRELATAFNKTIQDLAALRRRNAAVERVAAWREVARRVAHEIKNPLTPIRSSVETLRRLKARKDAKFDEFFDDASKGILDDVRRIASIASDFAKFAKLPPPRPAPVDLIELCSTVVAMHNTDEVPVELTTQPCPIIHADRDQITQVLTNLVQNSLDAVREAAKDTSCKPRVRVIVMPSGSDQVRLCVEDNGPGVPESLVSRLFEPYVSTKANGTGLGLSIVQRIVIEHGGEIAHAPIVGPMQTARDSSTVIAQQNDSPQRDVTHNPSDVAGSSAASVYPDNTPRSTDQTGARFVVTLPCAGPAIRQ